MTRSRLHTRPKRKPDDALTTPAPQPDTVRRPHLRLLTRSHDLPAGAGVHPAVAREMIEAQSTVGNRQLQRTLALAPAPAGDARHTWTSTSTLGNPLVFDRKKDAYVAKWALGEPPAEAAAVDLEEQVQEAAKVVDVGLQANDTETSLSATYVRVQLEHQFLNVINTMHKELRASETALGERRAELKKVEAELAAVKARLDKSTDPEEQRQLGLEVQNTEEKVGMQKFMLEAVEKNIASLRARIPAGIANLRLHEKTHLDLAADAAGLANVELRREKDPDVRSRIIDEAERIHGVVQDQMDDLLNPSVIGSDAETRNLRIWTGAEPPEPAAEGADAGPADYRAALRAQFAASKARGWTAETASE